MSNSKIMQFVTGLKDPDYDSGDGAVRYLDGSSLARPLDMPERSRKALIVFLVIAAIIGVFMLVQYFDVVVGGPQRQSQAVTANLTRAVDTSYPQMATLMNSSDEEIQQSFDDAGYTTYVTSTESDYPSGGFELVRFPSDMSLADATALYSKGISGLSATQASELLHGLWFYSVDRSSGTSTRLRYADFGSGSIDAAVQAAIDKQAFPDMVETDSGIDDAGNTFRTGTCNIDGESATWRVSAIELSSVYNISGLPDTAVFVGIRLIR